MTVCGYTWHPTSDPCMIITLQGVEMHSSGQSLYGITSLDGWANSGVGTGGPAQWETADGGIMSDVHFAGRSIVVEGEIDARDHAEYAEAVERLGAVLTRPRSAMLTVDELYHLRVTRQIEVARLRPVQISQIGPAYGIFTLTLEAAEFTRVEVEQRSVTVPTSGVNLENAGNADADLTLTLTGPLSGSPGISWPTGNGMYAGAWRYSGTVPAGTSVQVDLTRRTIRDLASSVHSGNLGAGTWLRLPPGTTRVSRLGSGAGSITAEWRSTWA